MAGTRKQPRLRIDNEYYNVKVYTPQGKRTQVSFGHIDERSEADVRAIFSRWLELYNNDPQTVFSYDSPYVAVKEIVNPSRTTTVGELVKAYRERAQRELRNTRDGYESPDLIKIRRAETFLGPYIGWKVTSFGPDQLRKVQKALIDHEYVHGKKTKHYTRRGINDTVNYIKAIWKWGLGRQLVKIENVQSFEEVKPLSMGQDNVHENGKRKRVTEEEFNSVVEVVSSVIGDMLKLVWYTAMRPYEVCDMKPSDILKDDSDCWIYIPGRDESPFGNHKTTRFERVRVIPMTKESQKILKPRLRGLDPTEYVFKPAEATKIINKKIRDKYDHNSFCRAVKRGCKRADVAVFVPYDLRRTTATGTRAILGKEAAKVLLGHAKMDTTDIYLLDEVQEAMKIAKLLSRS